MRSDSNADDSRRSGATTPTAPITLTVSELDLFLDGSTLVGRVALTPPALTHFSLASDRER